MGDEFNNTLKLKKRIFELLVASVAVFSAPTTFSADLLRFDWNQIDGVARTYPTLQVVVNPLIRRQSLIHTAVFSALKNLNAEYVRFVPWMPYPRLGVAELFAPTREKTSWDFSLIDPMVEDFFAATQNKKVLMNFSTIPQWMFETNWNVWFPADPNEATWNYQQGTELRDRSLKELADYYRRLVRWYTRGGFFDENGLWQESGHRYNIDTWEVFNEPDAEHQMSVEQYTERYDAVVSALREVQPQMKFMGLSLMRPMKLTHYFEYFLNPINHQPGIPLDWISYHFYAEAKLDEIPESQEISFFEQADTFLNSVKAIEAIRLRLSPKTKVAIDEVGTMMAEDFSIFERTRPIPDSYWSLSAATYAYLFAELTKLGIDMVAESQLVAFPTQFPSVTMMNWTTGEPNARYWVLKLILDNYTPGDEIVRSEVDSAQVYALAFRKANGQKKLLLINKKNQPTQIEIPELKEGQIEFSSPATNAKGTVLKSQHGAKVPLDGLAVAFLTF